VQEGKKEVKKWKH